MILDPDLVRYACVAHHCLSESSTILAEFTSADSSLQQLAYQCLELVPPHHSIFSHTHRNQTYTFLLNNDGYVYFGIFDSKLKKSDQVWFLGCLKEKIDLLIKAKLNFKFSSFCFQGELHPFFRNLTSKSYDLDRLHVAPNEVQHNKTSVPVSSKTKKVLPVSLLASSKIAKGLKKRLSEESLTTSSDALVHTKGDLLHDDDSFDGGEVKSRVLFHSNGNHLMDGGIAVGRYKAKKIWRRHVWIVLALDLAVCLILFGIWLFVCRGFQCVEG